MSTSQRKPPATNARRIVQDGSDRLTQTIVPAEVAEAPEPVRAFFRKLPVLVSNPRRRSWRVLIEILVEARVVPPEGSCGCSKPVRDGRGKDPFSLWVHANHATFRSLVGLYIPHQLRFSISEGIERYLSASERSNGYYPHELVRPLQDWLMTPVEADFARRFYGGAEVPSPWPKRRRRGRAARALDELMVESDEDDGFSEEE